MGGHGFSHHHHSSRSSSTSVFFGWGGGSSGSGGRIEYSNDEEDRCCCCHNLYVFAIIGPILLVLYLVLAIACMPKSKAGDTTLGLAETRPIRIGTQWYDSVRVDTPYYSDSELVNSDEIATSVVKLLKFKSTPPLDVTNQWSYTTNPSVAANSYYEWSWFLFPGSSIEFDWNYYDSLTMYIIQGTDNFDDFDDDPDDFYEYNAAVFNKYESSYVYNITEEDVYFVVLVNDNYNDVVGSVDITITSVVYDVSNAVANCTAPCAFPVDYNSNDLIIISTPTVPNFNLGSPDTEFDFNLYHDLRVWFATVFLFVIPCSVLIIASVMGLYLICRKVKNPETTPILSSEPGPT